MKKLFIQFVFVMIVFSFSSPILVQGQGGFGTYVPGIGSLPQETDPSRMNKADFIAAGYTNKTPTKIEQVACSPAGVTCTKYTYPRGFVKVVKSDGIVDYYYGTDTKPKHSDNTGVANAPARAVATAANNVVAWVKEAIYAIIYQASAFIAQIVGWAGGGFDRVLIELTPTSLDEKSTLQGISGSIEDSWRIIRDVASIVLIFSLLYLGIKTILDGNGFADKKTLVSIIVAAILLNFSLLFVRDVAFFVSNRVGREILQTAVLNNTTGEGSFSGAMLNVVGPQALFKTQDNPTGSYNSAQFSGNWGSVAMFIIQFFLLLFVLGIATLIFVFLAGLLIVRFIVFVVLMISAPLAVIAFTVPWLKTQGKTWIDELKKQTIFFPAFVFTMYIIFLIIGTLGSGAAIVDLADNSKDGFGTAITFFLNFALIIGFMIVLLIVPGKLSQGGSKLMGNVSGWGSGKIRSYMGRAGGAVAFGGTAMVGRNTVGRIASRTLSSDKIKLASQNEKGIKGMAARALLRGSDKAQNMSFDARATKAGGSLAKKYGLGTASAGWKGTVDNKVKELNKKKEAEMKMFGFGEDLPNADKSRKEIKAEKERDVLKAQIEKEKRQITKFEGSTRYGDQARADELKDSVIEKEAKLTTVYTNLDKYSEDKAEKQKKEKEAKQAQITNAQALLDVERQKLADIEATPESPERTSKMKIQDEAVKLREKEVQELQTAHDTVGVSPKQRHAKELAVAKANRNNVAKELKETEKELEQAQKDGKPEAEINAIIAKIEKQQKTLTEQETNVGRLMNRGADAYLKFAAAQRKSVTNFFGVSRSGKAAMEKVAKETKKQWQEKGKSNYKEPKKKKEEGTPSGGTSSTSSSGGSASISSSGSTSTSTSSTTS